MKFLIYILSCFLLYSCAVFQGPGGFDSESSGSSAANNSNFVGDYKVAFASNRTGQYNIYIVDSDGTNETALTSGSQYYYPSFSPDGSKIICTHNNDIVSINLSSGAETTLYSTVNAIESPSYSPDGSKIIFKEYYSSKHTIMMMDADGNNVNTVGFASNNYSPKISPDGSKIVFVSDRDGNYEIYIMDIDGNNQTRLTSNAIPDRYPNFSPDGTKIIFIQYAGVFQVFSMDMDGNNQSKITTNSKNNYYPSYSPDGSKIIYAMLDSNYNIYSCNLDGSDESLIPASTGSANNYPSVSKAVY